MQTYSHLLVTAVVDRQLVRRQVPVHTLALLTGSVLPDIPFFLLTVLGEAYFRWFTTTPTGESPMVYMHFTLFFTDPLWIVSHNFFHAPLILGVLGLAGFAGVQWGQHWGQGWGRVLLWFTAGAGLHTLIDIFTHSSDGPLLFFPFNWRYRFPSPVSYWERNNFGLAFTLVEHLVDVGILVYLDWEWRRRRRQRSVVAP